MLTSLIRFIVFSALALGVVVALFIAWWIAMIAAFGLMAYVGVRKLLGKPIWGGPLRGKANWNVSVNGRPVAGSGLGEDYRRGPAVIDGDFKEVQDARRQVERTEE